LHQRLFNNQDQLDAGGLLRQAKQAGLDVGQLRACKGSKATEAAIQKDMSDGRAYGVTGTPTVFVDGTPIRGAVPFSTFKTAIDAALKR
jgi:protein-disulfide isomerase